MHTEELSKFPLLYHAHHGLNTEDIPFWLLKAEQYSGPILELGCGTGRVFLHLWEAGHEVFGLDNDYSMLFTLIRHTCRQLPVSPRVFQADCAQFHLNTRFGLVIIPCNTYSTLSAPTRCSAIRRVNEHLLPGGGFIASLPNPDLLKRLPRKSEPQVEEVFLHPLDGEPVQVSSSWQRTQEQFIITWHYDHLLPNGLIQRSSTQVAHHLLAADAFLDELSANGLAIHQLYGDYDESPFSRESPNLIIVARKPRTTL